MHRRSAWLADGEPTGVDEIASVAGGEFLFLYLAVYKVAPVRSTAFYTVR